MEGPKGSADRVYGITYFVSIFVMAVGLAFIRDPAAFMAGIRSWGGG